MSKIPKIIHQTWKSKDIPDKYKDFVNSWKKLHPDWEYRLYDDEDCLQLVKTYYPQFLNTYLQLPTPVMKADMFRYLAVHQFGGLYADLDTKAFKSFNELLTGDYDMIVGLEIDFNNLRFSKFNPIYKSYYKKHKVDKQYVQYAFLATPKNPILYEIVENIHKIKSKKKNTHLDTFIGTGPAIFSRIVHANLHKKVHVLNVNAFNGITSILARYIFGINRPSKEAYLFHNEESSWKNKDDIIYTLLCCVVVALVITIFIFFNFGIIYFNKCKKVKSKKCIAVLTYCKIKKILMIFGTLLLVLIFCILINFAIQDRAYWPF